MNVLFDLDGTLCDPSEGIGLGFRAAMRGLGRPCPDRNRVEALIGRPLEDCFRALDCGEDSPKGAALFHAFFEQRGFAEAMVYDGIVLCLGNLRRLGWGLAVASSKPTDIVRKVVRDLGLAPSLDGVYGCGSSDFNPDKREIVLAALTGLGWSAGSCVLVGDRHHDREAAEAAGMPFVAVSWGFGAPSEHTGAKVRVDTPRALEIELRKLSLDARG